MLIFHGVAFETNNYIFTVYITENFSGTQNGGSKTYF